MNEELVLEELAEVKYCSAEEPVIFYTVNYLPDNADKLYYRSMKKHPERAEQITIDYCNMMLRNDKFTPVDVESTFKEAGVTKKYFIDENGLHIM